MYSARARELGLSPLYIYFHGRYVELYRHSLLSYTYTAVVSHTYEPVDIHQYCLVDIIQLLLLYLTAFIIPITTCAHSQHPKQLPRTATPMAMPYVELNNQRKNSSGCEKPNNIVPVGLQRRAETTLSPFCLDRPQQYNSSPLLVRS